MRRDEVPTILWFKDRTKVALGLELAASCWMSLTIFLSKARSTMLDDWWSARMMAMTMYMQCME